MNEKNAILRGVAKASRQAMISLLGEPIADAVLFHLKRNLESNPFEVLWENPKVFYNGLREIFGQEGGKVLVMGLAGVLAEKFSIDLNPGELVKLMDSEDSRSVKELQKILKEIANLYASSEKGGLRWMDRCWKGRPPV
ncbi:hypothetical protein J7K52_02925 [Candidatus Bathyarchaeota archaeon]|nr:hypothetical protein [Candidatus Bathyarchaeota archaeon]